jgi:hypothetical protein
LNGEAVIPEEKKPMLGRPEVVNPEIYILIVERTKDGSLKNRKSKVGRSENRKPKGGRPEIGRSEKM